MTDIRVVKGDPSAEELAALVLALLASGPQTTPGRRQATWRQPDSVVPTWVVPTWAAPTWKD